MEYCFLDFPDMGMLFRNATEHLAETKELMKKEETDSVPQNVAMMVIGCAGMKAKITKASTLLLPDTFFLWYYRSTCASHESSLQSLIWVYILLVSFLSQLSANLIIAEKKTRSGPAIVITDQKSE